MGGQAADGWGVASSLSAPAFGDATVPSHFPLGPLLAFQAAEFSIVNLETEKEAGRAGK